MTDNLHLWIDDGPRDGFHNMAVDQWLLETASKPVLRVYCWEPGWGSFGYFVGRADAEALIPDRRWVRRWTGGGIVDHQSDWTYTLVVPKRSWLAGAKGAESYRTIHGALAKALNETGSEVVLAGSLAPARGGDCFVEPVEFDLCDRNGRKLAGAGQRRTRDGLLHQGSLAIDAGDVLAQQFACLLARQVDLICLNPVEHSLAAIIESRYACRDWHERR